MTTYLYIPLHHASRVALAVLLQLLLNPERPHVQLALHLLLGKFLKIELHIGPLPSHMLPYYQQSHSVQFAKSRTGLERTILLFD